MSDLRRQIEEMEIQQQKEVGILREQFNLTCESLKTKAPSPEEINHRSHTFSTTRSANFLAGVSVALLTRKLFGYFYQRA